MKLIQLKGARVFRFVGVAGVGGCGVWCVVRGAKRPQPKQRTSEKRAYAFPDTHPLLLSHRVSLPGELFTVCKFLGVSSIDGCYVVLIFDEES